MLLERFLKYVQIDTMSSEDGTTTPSTLKQFDLAKVLQEELKELGLTDINLSDQCILTATLKTNCNSNETIGFIAHLDTIPGFSGTNVKPNIVKNYDGKVIELKNNVRLNPEQFPFMNNLIGKTLITTDGTTVLGADDKAGVAIIMDMLEYFTKNPSVPHKTIKVAFTPDEEIGGGIDSFDVKAFGADYAYTIDGGAYNEINYENFNAASAVVNITGLDPDSPQGDRICQKLFDDLSDNITVSGEDFPDLIPILAVVAGAKNGADFQNIGRLRLKESDRIEAVAQMLREIGATVQTTIDSMCVHPAQYTGGIIDAHNDHRIAMSAAIASTVSSEPVTILGAECVQKSYPDFWSEFTRLGGYYEQYIRR